MRGVGGGVGGPPLRDHLWQGPPLPVTLRLIHPPPKMTQGVMTPPNPPSSPSTASLSGVARCWHSNAYFSLILRYFSSTHRTDLSRFRGTFHSFDPVGFAIFAISKGRYSAKPRLIAGTAIVVALGAGALAYLLLPSGGENTATQTAESAPTVQPSPVAPVQAAPSVPEPSPAPSSSAVVALPDLPSSVTFDPAPQFAAAPPVNTATRQTVPASENGDTVLLQRPGVNI